MAAIGYLRLFLFAALRLGVRSFRTNHIATPPLHAAGTHQARTSKRISRKTQRRKKSREQYGHRNRRREADSFAHLTIRHDSMAAIGYSRLFFFAALRLGVRSFRTNHIATPPLHAAGTHQARTSKRISRKDAKTQKITRTIRSSNMKTRGRLVSRIYHSARFDGRNWLFVPLLFCGFAAWREILPYQPYRHAAVARSRHSPGENLKTNLTQRRKDAKNHANNTVIEHEDAGQTRLCT